MEYKEVLMREIKNAYLDGCNQYVAENIGLLPVEDVSIEDHHISLTLYRPLTASEAYILAGFGHYLPDEITDDQTEFELVFD